jgi:putative transferase (TIGR04331 family)
LKKNNLNLKPKILIISQLRPNLFSSRNSDILFFNEGCKLFKTNKKYKYEIYKNNKVLDYKINSLKKNFLYLLKVYEFFLRELSSILNKFHNLNYPVESWRIIIGPWLFEFISIIHHNWTKINHINCNYFIKYVEVAKFKNKSSYFRDYNDFVYSYTTDEFNNQICKDLLKYFKNIKIKFFFQKKKNKKTRSTHSDFVFRFLNFLSLLTNLFFNRKFFFHEPYFHVIINWLLEIRLGQFPSFYKSPEFKFLALNKKFREKKLTYRRDKFICILSDLIFKYIPVSYLENFNKYQNKAKIINWPENPKIIFSSNSFIHDDFFKIWLAQKKNFFKPKFISGQHGGGFFVSKFHFYELHQKKISDRILTWGCKKNNIHRPMFNFKTLIKNINFNPEGRLLFVDYELPRFPWSSLTYNNFSSISHLNNKLDFIKKLNNNIQKKLIFRPYQHNLGWHTLNKLKEIFKSIKIDRNENIYISLNNIRICVINLNSTVFLETLNLNLPTIIYFDPQQDLITNDAKYYFDILKEVNIYFDNSTYAAEHLNNIWSQVDIWWYSKKTQNAVNNFCNRYSKRTSYPISELAFFFKKERSVLAN